MWPAPNAAWWMDEEIAYPTLCARLDQFVEVGAGQSGSDTFGESLEKHVVTFGQDRYDQLQRLADAVRASSVPALSRSRAPLHEKWIAGQPAVSLLQRRRVMSLTSTWELTSQTECAFRCTVGRATTAICSPPWVIARS